MKHLRTKLAAVVVALLTAVVLAACGGAAQPASTTTQASAPTNAPAAAPTSAPATENSSAPTATPATTAPTDSPSQTAPTAEAATPAATSGAQVAASKKLNLNEVTQQELLDTIPNFGNRMVREFFEYRPYVSIQQFRREIGKYVSDEQVAEYEQYVYVPIDVDTADAETLQQLPGVDAAIAADLIAGRPYGSNQAFLAKLAERVSAGDLTAAEAYLVAK